MKTLCVRKEQGVEFFVVVVVSVVSCVFASLFLGRDLNWDYFNYHDYAALVAFDGDVQHYFPAGYQGYMNPLAYWLLGFLLAGGYGSLLVASFLASFHALNAVFFYYICKEIVGGLGGGKMHLVLCVLIGLSTPLFFSQLGSSFVDPVTTVFLMAGLLLVVRNTYVAWGCFFVGVACALKLTNLPYAAAVALCVFLLNLNGGKIRIVSSALAMLAGFFVFYCGWGFYLWQQYNSPFFPLFNDFFKSAYFPEYSVSFSRFIPMSWWDGFLLPLRMATYESWLYTEVIAPDIRPAILYIGLSLLLSLYLFAFLRNRTGFKYCASVLCKNENFVIIFVFFGFVFWVFTSANGRYALPLLFFIGPAIYIFWSRLLSKRQLSIFLLLLLFLQCFHAFNAGNPRWNPQKWTKDWLSVDIEGPLGDAPVMIVSVGTSSESYLVRHLQEGSVFVNPIGLISVPNTKVNSEYFESLVSRYSESMYVVFQGKLSSIGSMFDQLNSLLDRLGIRFVTDECYSIQVNAEPAVDVFFNKWLDGPEPRDLFYCKATKVSHSPELGRERINAINVLDSFEKKCPNIFSPKGVIVEGGWTSWSRFYGENDLVLGIERKSGDIFYRQDRQAVDTVIGNVSSFEEDLSGFECELPMKGNRGVDVLGGSGV